MSWPLIRPIPLHSESRQGYLLRLSGSNALPSPRRVKAEWLEQLAPAGALRGPIAGLGVLNAPDPAGPSARYWNTRRPRYCPCCLEEAPFWRSVWGLVFYTDCHRHATKLLDACSSCRRPLKWLRAELLQCSCGADLRCGASEQSPPDALKISGELARIWSDEVRGVPPGGFLVEELLHRTWFLGAYGSCLSSRALKLGNLFDVEVARAVAAASVLSEEDSTAPLIAWLEQVAVTYGDPTSSRLSKRFGAFYKELFDPRWERALHDLRAGFEQYVARRWPGQLAARNRRLSKDTRDAHVWVPVTAAAKLLGWKTVRLRSAIERGVVRGHLVRHPSGRATGTVHRDDLAKLREESRGEMTLLEVCAELRIGKKAAKALVGARTLVPTSGPVVDGRTIWKFRRSQIEAYASARAADPAAAAQLGLSEMAKGP